MTLAAAGGSGGISPSALVASGGLAIIIINTKQDHAGDMEMMHATYTIMLLLQEIVPAA